jgi:PAS domain S-box-containing protein
MAKGKNHFLENRSIFIVCLLFSAILIFGVSGILAYNSYIKATDASVQLIGTRAILLAKLVLENQRATIGILRETARQPLFVDSVKRKDFEATLQHLANLTKNNPEVEWPYVANPDSRVWINFPVDKQAIGKDLSRRNWYRGVSKEWKPYVSSVYKMLVGEKDLAITVSVPVFDEKGGVIGILGAAQSAMFFGKVIDEASSNSNISVTLIDQEGQIIYSNRFPYKKEVNAYPLFDFVKRALRGERGTVEVQDSNDENRLKYVSFAPLEGVGWSVITERGKDEVLRSEYPYLALIAATAFLIFGFVVLSLIYFRARHRQIGELEKANEELDERVCARTQSLTEEIFEHKRAQEALQESEGRFRTFSTASFEGIAISENGYLVDFNDQFAAIFGYERSELINFPIMQLVVPEDRDWVMGNIARAQESLMEHGAVRKDGTPIIVAVHGKMIGGPPLSRRLTVVRDITKRKQTEEAVRRGEARFKLLSDTAWRLLATDNPQGILNELCRDIMGHLDCQVFFNFLVDEEAGRLRLNTCAGIPEEEARKIEWLDIGVAVCGCVARDGARIVATDIFNTPDVRTELVKSFGIQAYACHPLICQDRVIGTLSFGTRTRTSFSSEDLSLMKTVADQVATAMERMRLIKELRRSRDELEKRVQDRTEELTKSQNRLQQLSSQLLLAQEKERKRVAVELHDGLLSELAATKYLLEGKIMLLEKGKLSEPGEFKRVVDILASAMKEARRIMNNLHPSILDELGLFAAINWLSREYEKSYPHIRVQQKIVVSEQDIAYGVRVAIYRVIQEALNNFARHGRGDRVDLSLTKSNNTFMLLIRDNGQGFDVGMAGKGLGLESMRERVQISDGEFQLESAIGQGTTIRAIWSI